MSKVYFVLMCKLDSCKHCVHYLDDDDEFICDLTLGTSTYCEFELGDVWPSSSSLAYKSLNQLCGDFFVTDPLSKEAAISFSCSHENSRVIYFDSDKMLWFYEQDTQELEK